MSKKFLGTGWEFPVELDTEGKLAYSSEEQKIQESILIILGTARGGERVMRPDFGSRLHEMVFAPINSSTKSLIAHYATEALVTWEARIDVLRVDVSDEEAPTSTSPVSQQVYDGRTICRFSLVDPFYLAEGRK